MKPIVFWFFTQISLINSMHNLTDSPAWRNNPEGHNSVYNTLRIKVLCKVGTSALDIQTPGFYEN